MVRHNNNVVDEKCRSGDEDVLCAMAKKAVDRSGGQLEVFVGEDFVDDDLLKYIADRYTNEYMIVKIYFSFFPEHSYRHIREEHVPSR